MNNFRKLDFIDYSFLGLYVRRSLLGAVLHD
jgi:hypothetical protein